MEQLGFLAHSLKGAAAYVAALEINRIAGGLEAAAKEGEADVAVALSRQLCAALAAGLPQLAAAADRVAAGQPGQREMRGQ
jgi:HPt (histidine-containing phosphotransfer) domain-containing protein